MILVTGATGHLGQSVVQQLKQHLSKDELAVLARNKDKAKSYINEHIEVRIADFNEPQTLEQAFQGIDKLLLISTMEQNRFEQHQHVIDAAKKSGVKHIVYTSLAIQNIETSAVKDLMISHFQTEEYIKQSGLTYTILRNTMYAEAIPQIIGERALEMGIHVAGGNGKVPYVLRAELGEATANLLMQNGHENQTYDFVGSHAYSYQDIAELLSKIKAEKVDYQELNNDAYRELLKNIGLPEFLIYLTHGTVLDIQQHQYEVHSPILEELLGRPSTALDQYLQRVYSK